MIAVMTPPRSMSALPGISFTPSALNIIQPDWFTITAVFVRVSNEMAYVAYGKHQQRIYSVLQRERFTIT